jgi:hypothetical protein
VDLSDAERVQLIEHYWGGQAPSGFDETLRLCAMQRLMQALGAYGFLGLVKGHKSFLQHIPAAVKSLRSIVAELGGLDELARTLATLPVRKKLD